MGIRWIVESISYRLIMPFPIKYNFISDDLTEEKNEYNRNRRIECLCFLLQYESIKMCGKRQFKNIYIFDGGFYIPEISDYCQVASAKIIPFSYKWYAYNEGKYKKWELMVRGVIEPYFSLSVNELHELLEEKISSIKIAKKMDGFLFKYKKSLMYRGISRLENYDTFLGGVKKIGLIVTYYFMMPMVVISMFSLMILIVKRERQSLVDFVAITALLLIIFMIFLFQILLSYNKIFKESAFEKEYKKMFNIKY